MEVWILLVTLLDIDGNRLETMAIDGFTTKEKCWQAGPRLSAYLFKQQTDVRRTKLDCVEVEK